MREKEKSIKVLLIDDDEDDFLITKDLLSENKKYKIEWVSKYSEAVKVLSQNEFEVVLVDYNLGDRNGLELVQESTSLGFKMPFILLTGRDDESIDLEAMRSGAEDYLIKGKIDYTLLDRSIRYSIERKRTEEHIKKLNENLEKRVRERTTELENSLIYAQSIITTVQEPILVLDKNLIIQTANKSFYTTFQTNKEETVGQVLYELGNGQWNILKLRKLLNQILKKDIAVNDLEIRHDFPKIGKRTMLLNASRLISNAKTFNHILLSVQDITERKSTEKALKENEQWLSTILNSIGDGVIVTDIKGEIKFMNPMAETLTEWSINDAHNNCLSKVFKVLDGTTKKENDPIASVINGDKEIELNINSLLFSKSGKIIPVDNTVAPIFDKFKRVAGVVLIFRDITKRKEIEDELKRSKDQLEIIFQGVADGIIVQETSGKLIYANHAAAESLHFDSVDDLLNATPEKINENIVLKGENGDDCDMNKLPARLALRGIIPKDTTIQIHFKDTNEDKWAVIKSKPIFDYRGNVLFAVNIFHDITERKRVEQQIYGLAFHDPLTNLPNRTLFKEKLKRAIAKAKENNTKVAVMFLDLDRFKSINDTFGHEIGDLLLQTVASRVKNNISKKDIVSRLGGDEFTIICSDLESKKSVLPIVNRIIEELSKPIILKGKEVNITPSIGIAIYPNDSIDAERLIIFADTAMYTSKRKGGNTFQYYSSKIHKLSMEKNNIENELKNALRRNEFDILYQPKVDIKTRNIIGVEALLRWSNSKLGKVSPALFIPIAEESGLINSIGKWVLEKVCLDNRNENKFKISVNISAQQLNEDLIDIIKKVIKDTDFNPKYLELEITESAVIQNFEPALTVLNEIKELGVEISMDDFGTGYSSLSYLQRLPVSTIKIDRSFILNLTNEKLSREIVKAIIAMAHSLKIKVIAEGVETKEQLRILSKLGCDQIQGFYFSPPIPLEKFHKLDGKTK